MLNNWLSNCCSAPVNGMDIEHPISMPIECSKCGESCGARGKMFLKTTSYTDHDPKDTHDYRVGVQAERDRIITAIKRYQADLPVTGSDKREAVSEILEMIRDEVKGV